MNLPLAEKIRPVDLDDVVGQEHIIAKGKPLRSIIEAGDVPNLIFYGPPGVGKTTVAEIIASKTKRAFRKLNGTTSGISDIKDIVSEIGTFSAREGVLLYLDEIQYFNKKQQQILLEYIEKGNITLIASTTENPYFYIYSSILSRSTVFEFKEILPEKILMALKRAIFLLEKENKKKIEIENNTLETISRRSFGDIRRAINVLESCIIAGVAQDDKIFIGQELVDSLTLSGKFYYGKHSDEHYDTISAFQKSMRGSDVDASIYYLGRLLVAGDLISACRRLMVCACEDVGLAYPQIIPIVKSCVDIALQLGLPEARIPLADAVILVALSPKSNSAYNAINDAISDIEGGAFYDIPRQLKNKHVDGDDIKIKGQFYKYPHDFKNHWTEQEYLPEELKNKRYYFSQDNKFEKSFDSYQKKIKSKVLDLGF